MKFKGTKGDWHVETSDISPMLEYGKKVYVSTKSDFIALIFGNSKQELKSNAQLISKTPELLERLRISTQIINDLLLELREEGDILYAKELIYKNEHLIKQAMEL